MFKTKKIITRKNKYLRIGKFRIKIIPAIIILCLVILIIAFVVFRKSDYWPWPSQSEIDQRMNDVLDACMYNENSRACKNVTSKFNLDFKYCYALSDIPEIDTLMPIYGVAQQKNFFTNPLGYEYRHRLKGTSINQTPQLVTEKDEDIVYPYYGCTSSIDEIKRQKGTSLISAPTTMALFGLSKTPYYSASGNYYSCSAGWHDFNTLWRQIPNSTKVYNEGENLRNIYNKCSMLSDLKVAASGLNNRLSAYANNYSVQLFYQKFDEWGQSNYSYCTWYDTKFNQFCVDSENGYNLNDFVSEMYKYLHTKYFTSRIIVSN